MPIDCVISYKNLHYRTFAALMQGRHGLLACGRNIVACTLPKPAGAWPGGKPQPRRHQVVGLSLRGGALQYRPFGVAIRAVRQCNTGCFATQNGPYCNALSASVLVALGGAASCRVLPEGMVNCGRGRQGGIYVATACTCRQPWPAALAAARPLADGPLEAWA